MGDAESNAFVYVISIFNCICFIFFIIGAKYFLQLGYRFLDLIVEEGYRLSFCRYFTLFMFLVLIDLIGKLNFTFLYTFNYMNNDNLFFDCDSLNNA